MGIVMQLLIDRANFRTTPRRENGWRRGDYRALFNPNQDCLSITRKVFVDWGERIASCECHELRPLTECRYRYPYRRGQSDLR
jgi:hypothetical protein